MRISDWSSDVCSSDLSSGKEITPQQIGDLFEATYLAPDRPFAFVEHRSVPDTHATEMRQITATIEQAGVRREIQGSGEDRKSVVEGKSVSVRVDLGGVRIFKK